MAEAAERKPVSWEPKLPLLQSVTKNGSAKSQPLPESVAVYRPTTELVDGMFLPPNNAKKLNKLMRKQVKDTAGKNWLHFYCVYRFGLFLTLPSEHGHVTICFSWIDGLHWFQLRSVLDPKRHYKKGDSKLKTLPKYFQASPLYCK
ncbi:hypothetical protein RHGRI_029881 [Rhododendron griersonianum]|uniref:Fcf2 pre-rRNA processing C-terminal domain-containing protein n=1 Tax=Rhododendron griersonianum TaxID=479676 RepID=A0AAV6IRY7_9ERIC|nr:hypothetical protein RHGRI_029881 [Rhododendron griersonianum]